MRLALALAVTLATLSIACGGGGPSKEQARQLVALSLASDADLQFAAFTGTFCESDEGRRLRLQHDAAVPSNAYAVGRMADNKSLKTLIANGYVEVKEETVAPDAAEGRHPACGRRDSCARCPTVSQYFVTTYQLTAKGKDLFLVTPITENDYMTLYNSGPLTGPFEDVQQEFSDDMPLQISVAIGSKSFDVKKVAVGSDANTAHVDYEWYWKPVARVEKTPLKQLVPTGHAAASVALKLLDDGWHLERDDVPQIQ